jgi:hypothetical protein
MKPPTRTAAISLLALTAAAIQAQTAPFSLTATLSPNPPKVGANSLDLLITDAKGAPATGLRLTADVFMTNMNMGTTHPVAKEAGKGHYKLVANFLMEGPWRITLKGGGLNQSLDFQAGNKQLWKGPTAVAVKPSAVTPPITEPVKPAIPPVTAPAKPVEPVTPPAPKPATQNQPPEKLSADKPPAMQGMDHKAMSMPPLKPTKTVAVTGNEDWTIATGFGQNDTMVAMMTYMMIGGSGMEGMKMAPMKMDFTDANYLPGATSAKEMPTESITGVKATAKLAGEPKVGDNRLEITLLDDHGKPVDSAKVTLNVAMTSMDMGTTHPVAKGSGKGKYSATAKFTMAGPWRVTALVTTLGGPQKTFTFDFEAK